MDFRIWSICVVKNEADIIAHCLREACRWSDGIFVLDNGSTDGTWEIVQSMANSVIVPWRSEDLPFRDNLRREVFEAFRHFARRGDWWCRLDADEFYVDSPKEFLARIHPAHHVVFGVAIEYYLVQADLERIDFQAPIEQILSQIRHYKVENTEQRFFRYRPGLRWTVGSWPDHMGPVSPHRILYRHYKYRSPEQIKTRLRTRQEAVRRGHRWDHWMGEWRDMIADPAGLCYDRQDGTFDIDWSAIPRHTDPPLRAFLKRLLHGTGIWP